MKTSNITGAYLQVGQLEHRIKEERIDAELIEGLEKILLATCFAKDKCAPFLYRRAADCLRQIIIKDPLTDQAKICHDILERFVYQTLEAKSLASAQSLGGLPLKIKGPELACLTFLKPKSITIPDLLDKLGFQPQNQQWLGRSLVLSNPGHARLLVLKFARNSQERDGLAKELAWLTNLKQNPPFPSWATDLPSPAWETLIQCNLKGLEKFQHPRTQKNWTALVFWAPRDYFAYPNSKHNPPPGRILVQTLAKTSFALGSLVKKGIFHTALIPLFHNRTQARHRADQGTYIWTRGGRLDRWYHSALHPNFGLSGLRDFEHLEPVGPGQGHSPGSELSFFRQLGSQLLSMILVVGSYFRNQESDKIGLDDQGQPYDQRHLFNPALFSHCLDTILQNYYLGFCDQPLDKDLRPLMARLVNRLIDELGQDKYMYETLRVRDQEEMTPQEFELFLLQHGYSRQEIKNINQGKKEIPLCTGPHLGEFNSRISCPELTTFVGAGAAILIGQRYAIENLNRFPPPPSSSY